MIFSARAFATTLLCASLLSGCFNSSEKQEWQVEPEGVQSNFAVPQSVRNKVDASSVTAAVKIDNGNWLPLTINSGVASGSIKGISKGTHTITVRFSYSLPGGGSLVLTEVSKSMNIAAGGNNRLTINDNDYDFDSFDDDKDGVNNADEIDQGTDPKDKNDFIPPVSTSSAQPASSSVAAVSSSVASQSSEAVPASSSDAALASSSVMAPVSSTAASSSQITTTSSLITTSSSASSITPIPASSVAAISSAGEISSVAAVSSSAAISSEAVFSSEAVSSSSEAVSSSQAVASSSTEALSSSVEAVSSATASSSSATTSSSTPISSASVTSSSETVSSSETIASSSAATSSSSVVAVSSSAASSSSVAVAVSSSSVLASSSLAVESSSSVVESSSSVVESSSSVLASSSSAVESSSSGIASSSVTVASSSSAVTSSSSSVVASSSVAANVAPTAVISDAENTALSGLVTLPETEYGAVTPSTLVLHAGNSSDDFNSALKYQWAIVNDSLSLKDLGLTSADLTAETLVITAPSLVESVDLAVSLIVTEDRVGGLASKPATLTVQIDANNDAPIAIAGYRLAGNVTEAEAIAVQVGQVVTVDGSLSSDSDDGIAGYKWVIAEADGTDAAFNSSPVGVARSITVPSAPAGAKIVLRLTATDVAGQLSSYDELTMLVDPSDSALPLASAVLITNPIMEGSEGNVIRSTSTDDTGIASYKWTSNDPAITFTSDDRKDGVFSVAELAINPLSSEFLVTLAVTDLAGKTASIDIAVKVTLKLEPSSFTLKDGDDHLLEGSEFLSYVGGRTLELQMDEVVGSGEFTFTSSNPSVAAVEKDGPDHALVTSGDTVGTTTITATQVSDGVYAAVSKSFTFRAQAPKAQAPLQIMGVDFSLMGYEPEAYKDITFALTTVGGSGTGKVVFSSDNTDAIEIDPDTGVAGVFNSGQATITATKQADGEFLAATATYRITVIPARRAVPDLVDSATATRLNGTTYTAQRNQVLNLSIAGEGSNNFNIYSSNESIAVASIDSPTDEVATVTFGGTEGSATITVTHLGDNFYQEVETTFIYTVAPRIANSLYFEDAESGTEVTSITCDSDCDATQLVMRGYQNGGGDGGQFTFTSSDPDVVRITGSANGTAEVLGLKAGQATITATRSADDVYEETSASFIYRVLQTNQLIINNADTDQLPAAAVNLGKTLNIKLDGYAEGGGEGGVFDIAIDNPSVARLIYTPGSTTATLEFTGLGTATVTASRTADDVYASIQATYSFTTKLLKPQKIAFETLGLVELRVSDTFVNTLYNPPGSGAITYSSDNPAVATVNEITGEVTAVSPGEATITGAIAEDDEFTGSMAAYGVSVADKIKTLIFTDADGNEITEINVALLPEGSKTYQIYVKNPVSAAYNSPIISGDDVLSAQLGGGTHGVRIFVSGAKYGTGVVTIHNMILSGNFTDGITEVLGGVGTLPVTVTEMPPADVVIPKPVIEVLGNTELNIGEKVTLQLVNPPEKDNGGRNIERGWGIIDSDGNLEPIPTLITGTDTFSVVSSDCFSPQENRCILTATSAGAGVYDVVAVAYAGSAEDISLAEYVQSDPIQITIIEPHKIVDASGNEISEIEILEGDVAPIDLFIKGVTTSSDVRVNQSGDIYAADSAIDSAGHRQITLTGKVGVVTIYYNIDKFAQVPGPVLEFTIKVVPYRGARAVIPNDLFTTGDDVVAPTGTAFYSVGPLAVGNSVVYAIDTDANNVKTFRTPATGGIQFGGLIQTVTDAFGLNMFGNELFIASKPSSDQVKLSILETSSPVAPTIVGEITDDQTSAASGGKYSASDTFVAWVGNAGPPYGENKISITKKSDLTNIKSFVPLQLIATSIKIEDNILYLSGVGQRARSETETDKVSSVWVYDLSKFDFSGPALDFTEAEINSAFLGIASENLALFSASYTADVHAIFNGYAIADLFSPEYGSFQILDLRNRDNIADAPIVYESFEGSNSTKDLYLWQGPNNERKLFDWSDDSIFEFDLTIPALSFVSAYYKIDRSLRNVSTNCNAGTLCHGASASHLYIGAGDLSSYDIRGSLTIAKSVINAELGQTIEIAFTWGSTNSSYITDFKCWSTAGADSCRVDLADIDTARRTGKAILTLPYLNDDANPNGHYEVIIAGGSKPYFVADQVLINTHSAP